MQLLPDESPSYLPWHKSMFSLKECAVALVTGADRWRWVVAIGVATCEMIFLLCIEIDERREQMRWWTDILGPFVYLHGGCSLLVLLAWLLVVTWAVLLILVACLMCCLCLGLLARRGLLGL